MDFETFITSLFNFVKNSDNAYFVMYALATCLLTQPLKKLTVNKIKVDVLHKFDFAVVLPFVLGTVFAVIDAFCVKKVNILNCKTIGDVIVNGAAIGALATAVFKLVSSVTGNKLSALMKDDVFSIFYTLIMYFGNAREQLLSKRITLKGFSDEVKLIASNALDIYKTDADEDTKRANLAKLMSGIIDEDSVNVCVNSLNKALINYVAKTDGQNKKQNT